jgi:DNA polymerase III subunit epsilon
MDFVAIDVETANADMASVCQIGIARFANGVMADEWTSYIDPQDYFDVINVSIHGIDEAVVAGAPTFEVLANTINGLLNGHVVVTHTNFDKVAISQACKKCKAMPPSCTWLDSAEVVRRTWKELSQRGYGLQNVCGSIGYKFQAHDALEDAKAAGNIMLAAMTQTGLDLDAWLTRVRQPIDPKQPKQPIAREGCPDGELYGEVLVFTGALTIPRREAANMAASIGCEIDAGVTKRTTILVVGNQDVLRLAGHKKSSKHRKAEELIGEGQSIRILRETDFRELVKLAN